VSYTMGTESFPGINRPGRGVNHPPRPGPTLKKKSSTSSSPSVPSRHTTGQTFTFLQPIFLTYVHPSLPQFSYQQCNVLVCFVMTSIRAIILPNSINRLISGIET